MSGAGAFGWSELGCSLRWSWETLQLLDQTFLPPALGASQQPYVESRLPTTLVLVPAILQLAKGTRLPCVRSGLGHLIFDSHCSLPRVGVCVISLFLQVSSQGHRSRPDHSSSLPTSLHVYLSYSLSCLSTSFQLVFSENCSACR